MKGIGGENRVFDYSSYYHLVLSWTKTTVWSSVLPSDVFVLSCGFVLCRVVFSYVVLCFVVLCFVVMCCLSRCVILCCLVLWLWVDDRDGLVWWLSRVDVLSCRVFWCVVLSCHVLVLSLYCRVLCFAVLSCLCLDPSCPIPISHLIWLLLMLIKGRIGRRGRQVLYKSCIAKITLL